MSLYTTLAIGEEDGSWNKPSDPYEEGGKIKFKPIKPPVDKYPELPRPGEPKDPGDGGDYWATTMACGEEGNDCGGEYDPLEFKISGTDTLLE